jgi:hypothetical protein
MRILTSSVFHGIYLFHSLFFFRWALETFPDSPALLKLGLLLILSISFLLACDLCWNIVPSGVLRYSRYIHGIVGSIGYISPFVLYLCLSEYASLIQEPPSPRISRINIPSICLDMFVSLLLEYVSSTSGSSSSLIPVTSFLLCSSWVLGSPENPRITESKIPTSVPKFSLHRVKTIVSTESILVESMLPLPVPKPSLNSLHQEWQYIDLQGTVQGPFPREQMASWYKAGFLKDDLKVSPGDSYTFRSISDLFSESSVPFD